VDDCNISSMLCLNATTYSQRLPSDHLASCPELPSMYKCQPTKSIEVLLLVSLPPFAESHSHTFLGIPEVFCLHIIQQPDDPLFEMLMSGKVIFGIPFAECRICGESVFASGCKLFALPAPGSPSCTACSPYSRVRPSVRRLDSSKIIDLFRLILWWWRNAENESEIVQVVGCPTLAIEIRSFRQMM
jgi:hypothetical protein